MNFMSKNEKNFLQFPEESVTIIHTKLCKCFFRFGVVAVVFSSLIFLYLFLPACLLAYFCFRRIQTKNIILLIFSLVFYAWGEPIYVFLLMGSAAFNYAMGRFIGNAQSVSKRKVLLGLTVTGNLLLLGVFKYADMVVETLNLIPGLGLPLPGIALPIGISFFTFQALSYVVEVYRGQVEQQKNYLKFLLYISMFPQLIAGPIVRYADIAAQMDHRTTTREDLFYGLIRFSTGLAKKILLADHAYSVATQLLDGSLSSSTVVGTWLGILMFTFQIYFDFSGYSDMAIGLGRILGFKFMENFKLPYTATSVTDFWRRWHISLSSFFRDYVYIPLGGKRKHRIFNLLIVWALTGLWHGASWNFLLWGLYFFLLLTIEKPMLSKLRKVPKILRQLTTMLFVVIGWTIFYFTDFARLGQVFSVLFGFSGAGFINQQTSILLLNNLLLLVLCVLGSTALPRHMGDLFGALCASKDPRAPRQKIYVIVTFLFCLTLLVLSTVSLVGSGFSAFIYYRF